MSRPLGPPGRLLHRCLLGRMSRTRFLRRRCFDGTVSASGTPARFLFLKFVAFSALVHHPSCNVRSFVRFWSLPFVIGVGVGIGVSIFVCLGSNVGEDCGGRVEEESLMRRTLESNIDYIYTQNPQPWRTLDGRRRLLCWYFIVFPNKCVFACIAQNY